MATVVVQLGHCYRRSGSVGTTGEQDFNRAAAAHTAGRLGWYGHTCKAVLADDPIPRSDVFVAIHADGSNSAQARGASVGYRNDKGGRIGAAWKAAYQRLGWPSGFRADNYTAALRGYYGVRRAVEAGTPWAFIIEGGFLTNPDDRAQLQSEQGQARVAQAIVDAVGAVCGHPETPQQPDQKPRDERPLAIVRQGSPEQELLVSLYPGLFGDRRVVGVGSAAEVTGPQPADTICLGLTVPQVPRSYQGRTRVETLVSAMRGERVT